MAAIKYVNLYFKLVSAGIRAQMQYRFAFIMRIIGLITAYTGTAVTMWVMLYQFQVLGSWNFFEMLFLSGDSSTMRWYLSSPSRSFSSVRLLLEISWI